MEDLIYVDGRERERERGKLQRGGRHAICCQLVRDYGAFLRESIYLWKGGRFVWRLLSQTKYGLSVSIRLAVWQDTR